MNEALNRDIEHNAKAQVVKEAKTEKQANNNINNGLTLEPSDFWQHRLCPAHHSRRSPSDVVIHLSQAQTPSNTAID